MEQTNLTITSVMKYPNARVLVNAKADIGIFETEWHIIENGVFEITQINLLEKRVSIRNESEYYCVHIADCKLILKSLGDISEGDAVEVAKIMGVIKEEDPKEDWRFLGNYTKHRYLGLKIKSNQMPSPFSAWEALDKLRELNYALPNLPESVWVDEKLTTKSE